MSRKEQEERLGGSDARDWASYDMSEERAYYDKPDHFARSAAHQPSHERAAKKKGLFEERIEVSF